MPIQLVLAAVSLQPFRTLNTSPDTEQAQIASATNVSATNQSVPSTSAPSASTDASTANDQPAPSQPDQPDIIIEARSRSRADPFQYINAKSFAVAQSVDDAVVAPISHSYEKALPRPVRFGLRNFLNNLHEPIVLANFLFQRKVGKAFETAGRFGLNTTVGIAGFVDIAKRRPFNLPRRPNGFANTLGFYGVKPGPFFFLPLVGPTTLRDFAGGVVDGAVLPLGTGAPFNRLAYSIPTAIVRGLDRRIMFDGRLRQIRESHDPYVSARTFYLSRREAEIDALHGRDPSKEDALIPE